MKIIMIDGNKTVADEIVDDPMQGIGLIIEHMGTVGIVKKHNRRGTANGGRRRSRRGERAGIPTVFNCPKCKTRQPRLGARALFKVKGKKKKTMCKNCIAKEQ